jgi:hypothetical protein
MVATARNTPASLRAFRTPRQTGWLERPLIALSGMVDGVDAVRLASYRQDEQGLWVYGALRDRADLQGLFVAPNVFTRPADLVRLADELERIARVGLPG